MNQKLVRRAAVVVVLVVLVLLFSLSRCSQQEEPAADTGTPKLGYAEGVTVVEDPDALQKAVDKMYQEAAEGGIALEYRNDASSTDGTNFSCYIGNSVSNGYDMYIQIFADAALSDQLYLSGLLRPGSAFDNLTLDRPLETGTHTVYVVHTQVEEDLETIHAQVIVTMNFTVS